MQAEPFDDIRSLVNRFAGPDRTVSHIAAGSETGRGGDILRWMAGWSGRAPQVTRPLVAIFAGTHGIAEALHPGTAVRTRAAVEAIAAGSTALNRACAAADLGLKVFDLALDVPTADISHAAALDERGCAATMAFGMEAIAGGTDLLVLGASGEGGEIAAAALIAALLGEAVAADLAELPQSLSKPIREALATHAGVSPDPLAALASLGGRETAALAGAIMAARLEKVPVLLDGLSALAAAVVVKALRHDGVDHCMLGDLGAIGLQRTVAEQLGMDHVVDMGIGAGDGTGGAVAAAALRSLVATAEPLQRSAPH